MAGPVHIGIAGWSYPDWEGIVYTQALKSLTVIMNNHYRGAELANAIEMKFLVTGQRQPVPDGLLRTYPSLEQVALPVARDSLLPP
jgi:uncharacterized protein YecE (DUF72 family)